MSAPSFKAIIHPKVDPWLVGGLSIPILLLFIVMSSRIPQELILGNFLILTVLVNGTHFMASYFLLYSSREYISRYKTASIYVPIALLVCGAAGLWMAAPPRNDPAIIQGLLIITALYLALHYTGQAWGMMASYAYLNEIRFTNGERFMLRGCLRVMAVWQMVWALTTSPSYIPAPLLPWANGCMLTLNGAGVISLIAGLTTLLRLRLRLQRVIPISIVLPFASLYVWYIFLYIHPQSLFWVQIFHATQYLAFPLRVESNRAERQSKALLSTSQARHLLGYTLTLSGASLFVFVGIDKALNYPTGGFETYSLVLVSLINIHHYFIDGCVWHIRSPEVREDLFAHTQKSRGSESSNRSHYPTHSESRATPYQVERVTDDA
jgi:hypothetical protein